MSRAHVASIQRYSQFFYVLQQVSNVFNMLPMWLMMDCKLTTECIFEKVAPGPRLDAQSGVIIGQ